MEIRFYGPLVDNQDIVILTACAVLFSIAIVGNILIRISDRKTKEKAFQTDTAFLGKVLKNES